MPFIAEVSKICYSLCIKIAKGMGYMKKIAIFVTAMTLALTSATTVFGAQWKKDQKGWWYDYQDGSYAKAKWERIGGTWYLFNADGYMCTGWQKVGQNWYYLRSSGVMKTGWLQDGQTWYYLRADGSMASSQWIGDYYVTASGAMAVNTTIDGYQVGADGKVLTTNQEQKGQLPLEYWMEISAGKNTELLKMQFKNNSAAEMKLLNGENLLQNARNPQHDRRMTLADEQGNPLPAVMIQPGETKLVYYRLSSAAWYDSRESVMVVEIEHSGGSRTILYGNIFNIPVN